MTIRSLSLVLLLGLIPGLLPAADAPPAGQQAKRPEPKPAAGKMVPGPWFNAKVGDTMVHRDSLGTVSTRTVVKVDETIVTVESVAMRKSGKAEKHTWTKPRMVPAPTKQPAGNTPGTNDENQDLGTATLTISGRKIACKVTQVATTVRNKNTVTKFWKSAQVPGEIVKREALMFNGSKYVDELVEFKRGK